MSDDTSGSDQPAGGDPPAQDGAGQDDGGNAGGGGADPAADSSGGGPGGDDAGGDDEAPGDEAPGDEAPGDDAADDGPGPGDDGSDDGGAAADGPDEEGDDDSGDPGDDAGGDGPEDEESGDEGSDDDQSGEDGSDDVGADDDGSDDDASDEEAGDDDSDQDGSDDDSANDDDADDDGSGEDGSDDDGAGDDGAGDDASDDGSDDDGLDEGDAGADDRPEGSSDNQDGWLKNTLGIDLSDYADRARNEAETLLRQGKMLVGMDPDPTQGVGKDQSTRAERNLEDMPPDDQKKVNALLDNASDQDNAYLKKALASGHSADEIAAFNDAIKDKDDAWKQKNLHLVGDADGTGVKQQWHDSCQATVTQAMKGEMDPVYALKTRQANADVTAADDTSPTDRNNQLADEQRALLENAGGKAVPRADEQDGRTSGMTGMLNGQQDTTGVTFQNNPVTAKNVDQQMDDVDQELAGGTPVPIRLGSDDDKQGHAAMITGVDPGPPRTYAVHDPWDGKIVKVTDQQIRSNQVGIQGYNRISDFYHPSPVRN